MPLPERICIIGVPQDLGAERRGVDMGPSAVRVAGLQARLQRLSHQVEDIGNLPVRQAEEQPFGDARVRFLPEITDTCLAVAAAARRALAAGVLPLVLGGDHSIAVGSISSAASSRRSRNQRLGCLWLDAHGDMNTPETTPSGNLHGMPLAILMGAGVTPLTDLLGFAPKLEPGQVAVVGVRDLDPGEREFIAARGVHVYTMRDIDERGMRDVMADALRHATTGTDGIAVSLDLDVVDPTEAPGVGTPVRGGVTYREAHLALEMIADSKAMVSFDITEINPLNDVQNQTAQLAVELVLSGLGQRIL